MEVIQRVDHVRARGCLSRQESGDKQAFEAELRRLGGASAAADWRQLLAANEALAALVAGVPPIALRADVGALQTASVDLRAKA